MKRNLLIASFGLIIVVLAIRFIVPVFLSKTVEGEEGTVKQELNLDGSVKSEVRVEKNKKDGIEKVYYKSGRLKEENTWRNGVLYSHCYSYYDSYDTLVMITESDTLLSTRSKLKQYKYVNELNQINYRVDFDKSNGVTDVFGKTMPEYWMNKKKFSYGDTLKAVFVLPLPFYVDYRFRLGEFKKEGEIFNLKEIHVDFDTGKARYQEVITESKNKKLCVISELIYDDGFIDSDTIYFDIEVESISSI